MAIERGSEVYLSHYAQEVDDVIDEVYDARTVGGTHYDTLGEAIRSIGGGGSQNSMVYMREVDYISELPDVADVGRVYIVKYTGSSGQNPSGQAYVCVSSYPSATYAPLAGTEFVTCTYLSSRINGFTFRRISLDDYNNLPVKDADTIYFVQNPNGAIEMHMGDTPVQSGLGGVGNSVPQASGFMQYYSGNAVEVQE